ncbi:hypothetical protein KIW84_065419 [Lathyrus oleraceus]|uniref:Uncharacterized protein n=1 Tax=Pisum sativum TaxID=3888 RepID=A0A9D4WGQ2_PEA|nr:hypothetical protein KIW84_065419 [Pisum sativum]
MASQLSHKGKGKGKASSSRGLSSSRGSLDLSRLFTTRQQQERLFFPELVKVFYSNMVRKKGKLTSVVKGVPISLTASDICAIFEIPPGGHKFVGTLAPWENYSKHAFYYSLSRLMLHYFLVYVVVPRFSNHCTITDPEFLLLYSIKTNFHVDWGHSILSHMMSHDEHAEGLPYAHLLTKNFRHFNVNLENELCFSMAKPSFMIRIKQINRKMGVVFNPQTYKIKYLDIEDEEPQEANNDDEFNPPINAPPAQPSNQMIMDYLQGFRTEVMTEIGHLSSRMDRRELSQTGFQGSSYQGGGFQGGDYPGGGSNDGNNNS